MLLGSSEKRKVKKEREQRKFSMCAQYNLPSRKLFPHIYGKKKKEMDLVNAMCPQQLTKSNPSILTERKNKGKEKGKTK